MRLPHPSSPNFGLPSAHAMARRRTLRANAQLATLLMLDNLESRLLMAGAATQLLLTVPPSQTAVGTPMFPAIQVTVADALGATVTTDASTVNLTLILNPGGGSLTVGGSVTATATAKAVNGVATFSNLSFTAVGQYEIAANDGSLLGVVSTTFSVSASPAKLVFSQPPSSTGAGIPFSPAISVFVEDANGNLVSTDRSAVTLSISSGPSGGTLTGVTTINANNGVVTFNGVSLSKPGQYRLQVKDGSLTLATSNLFTVSAGAPARLVFQQQPVNTPQGGILAPVVVDVTDSGGNVTTDNSAVTLILLGTGGALTGTTTVNAVNGVATFSDLSIAQLGRFTLQASDGLLAAATSNTFAITGQGTQLAFLQGPVQTTAGHAIAPGVTLVVEDVNGNVVTNDSSSVTITATGPGALSGTTSATVVNGAATFSNLRLSELGTYTLTAGDGGLTPATSSAFLVNGTASQLVFIAQPTQTAVGAPIQPPVTVAVEDSAGNIVINDTTVNTTSMTMVVVGGPSGGEVTGTASVPVVSGVATFSNLMLSAQGTYTLKASDLGLFSAPSASFIVLPAPHLLIVTQPSDVALGSVMFPSVVVDIVNVDGTLASANNSQVTLTLATGPRNGSIGGTTTVTAVAGVATFSDLTFAVQGTYQFTVTDGALATDLSRKFNVTAPAYQLQWATQPVGTLIAGQTLNVVTAWVEDRNKHVITSDHSVVTLAISRGPAGGTITGNATANASDGEVFFTGLSFTKAGTYVLTVTDGSLLAAKSKIFNVVPATATSQLLVSQSPPTTLVGNHFSPQVIVEVADVFGNVIHSGSAISLAIQSGPGGVLSGSQTVHASNGVAHFNNLSINLAGSYVLLATDLSLNTMTTSFNVTISQVVSSIATPSTPAVLAANEDFTLKTKLRGLVNSSSPWTGTVDLLDSNNVMWPATSTIQPNGNVTLVVNGTTGAAAGLGMTAGTYTVRVQYQGDANHLGSISQAFTLVVGPTTKLAVTPSAKQIAGGGTLDMAVQVSAGSSTVARTGVVQLMENGTLNQSVALNGSSHADFILSPINGTHTYTVVYPGDLNFRSGTSSSIRVTVGLATTASLSTPAQTLGVGDTLNLTVKVKAGVTGSPAPTGTVQLLENGTLNQSITLNGSSSASISLTPLLGAHQYTVNYLGDGTYRESVSSVLNITVNREATTATVVPSPTTIAAGATLTVNTQVNAANGTSTPRTGTVLLRDRGVPVATATLGTTSHATFTLTAAAGQHIYSVQYVGDANFLSCTSPSVKLTVSA